MDVNNKNLRPMCSTRYDLAATLSNPECIIHKSMTESPSYETAFRTNLPIDVNTASAFHDRVLAAIEVQKAKESQVTGTKTVEEEKRAMKLESVAGQSSRDTLSEIVTVLADLGVVTRAKVTEIIESRMAKINGKSKAEVVKTVADTAENAPESRFLDSNEGLQSAMFNIVEHGLTKVIRAGRGRIIEEIQLACLMKSEPIVEQTVQSVLSSTKFIVPIAAIFPNLVNKSSDNQRLKTFDRISTPKILTELLHERSAFDCRESQK